MATVILGQRYVRQPHYGLCLQTVGGDYNVLVRRKFAVPNDTLHPHSRNLRLQRQRFSKASKDYAALPWTSKQSWRRKLEYT